MRSKAQATGQTDRFAIFTFHLFNDAGFQIA